MRHAVAIILASTVASAGLAQPKQGGCPSPEAETAHLYLKANGEKRSEGVTHEDTWDTSRPNAAARQDQSHDVHELEKISRSATPAAPTAIAINEPGVQRSASSAAPKMAHEIATGANASSNKSAAATNACPSAPAAAIINTSRSNIRQ